MTQKKQNWEYDLYEYIYRIFDHSKGIISNGFDITGSFSKE